MERTWKKVTTGTLKEIRKHASADRSALDVARLVGTGISRSTVRLILQRENLPCKKRSKKAAAKAKRRKYFDIDDFKHYYKA